jgi:hypothetical protein
MGRLAVAHFRFCDRRNAESPTDLLGITAEFDPTGDQSESAPAATKIVRLIWTPRLTTAGE